MTPLTDADMAPCDGADAQCAWMLSRIGELRADLAQQADAALARPGRQQLQALHRRIRELGCLSCRPRCRLGMGTTS